MRRLSAYVQVVLAVCVLSVAVPLEAQTGTVLVVVTDENAVAVPGAQIAIPTSDRRLWRCETDHSGRCMFPLGGVEGLSLTVEKLGFYRFAQKTKIEPGVVEVTLVHQQEIKETVDVVESPPAIDVTATAKTETLTSQDVLNIPFPTSREVRNALPLMPQVVKDMAGNIHVGGTSATQTLNLIDGFNVTEPAALTSTMHVNTDAVRTIKADITRYSAEYGKGNSVLAFNTGMGDDRYRFAATNFIPGVQLKKGVNFDKWVPRFVVSGPIKRGRVWFYDALDFEYGLNIVDELPDGADRSWLWRGSNLSKVQVNITPANILTGQFLVNHSTDTHAGLSAVTPLETTIDRTATSFLAGVRDQHYFKSGSLLDVSFGVMDYSNRDNPLGSVQYDVAPEGPTGSYFRYTRATSRRYQGAVNFFLRPIKRGGNHDLKFGGEVDRISMDRSFGRRSVNILREDRTLTRRIDFVGGENVERLNTELSAYVQDRWSPTERWLVESGVRVDWDQVVREPVFAPRLATSFALNKARTTKISAGVGLFYGVTNLDVLSRASGGHRVDTWYLPDGSMPSEPPITTTFVANTSLLEAPRFVNYSVGLEQKLPRDIYLNIQFVQKNGTGILTYLNPAGAELGTFNLVNGRNDRYRAIEFTARHTFKNRYPILVSYTRSKARTNALLDFHPDSPAIGQQFGGPLPWDTPNRFLTWGWLPFIKGFTIGYSVELRDGMPFLLSNQNQQVVQTPETIRFPRYFMMNVSAERRFRVLGMHIALRGAVENVTNQRNPNVVVNNIDSPQFLVFSGQDHRTFNLRIRFLGRSRNPAKDTQAKSQP